jgi:ribonuclease HI
MPSLTPNQAESPDTTKTRKRVIVHTDGSCLGNPGPGGWAAILEYINSKGESKTLALSGGEAHTTNNRMELTGAIRALEALLEPCSVTIVTDSKYVQHAFTKRWLEGWQKNGWKTSSKEPVKNKDLWERLLELSQIHTVDWDWTKGHAGHDLNERADKLANTEARKIARS